MVSYHRHCQLPSANKWQQGASKTMTGDAVTKAWSDRSVDDAESGSVEPNGFVSLPILIGLVTTAMVLTLISTNLSKQGQGVDALERLTLERLQGEAAAYRLLSAIEDGIDNAEIGIGMATKRDGRESRRYRAISRRNDATIRRGSSPVTSLTRRPRPAHALPPVARPLPKNLDVPPDCVPPHETFGHLQHASCTP